MRQVVLDTETTGLELELGHRVIEIGCVELVNRRDTGRHFHRYLCPDRDVETGAWNVHGITREFLADKPRFGQIAEELVAFVDGAELIIHNAAFDVAFLDMELKRLSEDPRSIASICTVLDTLALARQMHPGQRNSLDALCRRYHIDNSRRDLHGALLDAKLLSNVYLAMTGGQGALTLDAAAAATGSAASEPVVRAVRPAIALIVLRPDAEELAAHERVLDAIDKASAGQCVWRSASHSP
jgi:DNA polymerase III subunit epsilon